MSTRTRDWLVLERMGENQLEILPVVSRADVHKLEGIVTLRDVLIPTA
jgi:CIC family chloride channel protein